MYWEIDRDHVQFDGFESCKKAVEKFKIQKITITIKNYNSKDSFYKAILYGLVYKLFNKEKKIDKNLIKQILGKEFFDCFGKKDLLQLDKSFCNFEKKNITLPTRP